MTFTVIVTPRARGEIAANVRFLHEHFGERKAVRWRDRIEARIALLADRAANYAEAEESAALGFSVRELPFGRKPQVFRILYEIRGQTVYVLSVRHAAQDWLSPDDL